MHDDLEDLILFKIPNSVATGFRGSEIKCKYNKEHKMDVQRRRCDEFVDCLVKYKVHKCEICNKYQLLSANLHNHEVDDDYDNLNGLHKIVKEVILKLMDSGKTQPKQIHVFLTNNQEQLKDVGVPKLQQVQGFVVRSKPTFKTRNLIRCVVDFILLNQFSSANIENETKPFVFGTKFDDEGKPIVGNGTVGNHLNILMTSLALLKRLDTTNQDQVSIFHIDGNYRITRNKFPLVIFGRTDISRHFHPIVFFLTSHEQEVDFAYFYAQLKMLVDVLKTAFNIQINFTFTYLMQDACQASYNGLKAVYPYVYVLMCCSI